MITPSINYRSDALDSPALIPQPYAQQRSRPQGKSGTPYTVSALAGSYHLETHLTLDRDQPTQVWFDAAVQGRARTPALDSLLFLRITPAADPQRVLAGLVSLADASTGNAKRAAGNNHRCGATLAMAATSLLVGGGTAPVASQGHIQHHCHALQGSHWDTPSHAYQDHA
jgi:hypothetical protein